MANFFNHYYYNEIILCNWSMQKLYQFSYLETIPLVSPAGITDLYRRIINSI